MFIGRHDVSVDPKGRVYLPAKFREALDRAFEAPLIVTVSDRCLAAYPSAQWMARYRAFEAEPYTPERGDLLRALTAHAEEVPIRHGKILVPARLREYAGIDREAVLVGRIDRFEVWSAERHRETESAMTAEQLSARLRELGL